MSQASPDRPEASAASIPYEGTDCTPEESVEAVKAVRREAAPCEWCGRAVARNTEGRWFAVKGEERSYDPLTCEASDDCRHYPPDGVR